MGELETRKRQAKKMRSNGVIPSAALCVFNQIDFDKSRTISNYELWRLLKALNHIYPTTEEEIKDIMATLDTDRSGEIDEQEWIQNLSLLPKLEACLMADVNPDTGKLKSFRTPRQQFAKILGNIDRLEYDQSKGKDVSAELQSRRKMAQRYRQSGIIPSAGIMVFQQLDKKKTRKVGMDRMKDLLIKLKYDNKDVEEVMKILDADGDGFIDDNEWLEQLDKVPSLKVALEKDIDPESGKIKVLLNAGKSYFDMLRRQEGKYAVDEKEVGRYLKAAKCAFKLEEKSMDDLIEKLLVGTGTMDPEQWDAAVETMPQFKAKLEADYMPDRVRFKTFRSCGQQLSKLFANLDRLRLRDAKGEDVTAEIATRKKQVKKLRANGVQPSPGVSVFAQMDLDKSGTISEAELFRLFKSMAHIYKKSDEEIKEIMKTLDSDGSGEIDELEWRHNLAKCPGLLAALVGDLDPDTGKLRSYRTMEQQLAKLLGNIERLEQRRKEGKDVAKELESRKTQAKRMREKGIMPAPGTVVFNQIDKDKSRSIDENELKDVVSRVGLKGKDAGDVMKLLDRDGSKAIEEHEWLEGLERVQSLKAALMKNIDPDTGKLKCMD